MRKNGISYVKFFDDDTFFASGMLYIEPLVEKPSKTVRHSAMTFFVHRGQLQVAVQQNKFLINSGGTFYVPRGMSSIFIPSIIVFALSNLLTQDNYVCTGSRRFAAEEYTAQPLTPVVCASPCASSLDLY